MEPADADAYFGKVLRDAAKGTRLARSQALKTYFLFVEIRHKAEIHQMTGRMAECPVDEMNRPRGAGRAALRIPPSAVQGQQRDVAIARLIRGLLEAGAGINGVRMLKRTAERDIRRSSSAGDETALTEEALRILYQRKAFREETGVDEEHYPEGNHRHRRHHHHTAARHTAPGLAQDPGTKSTAPAETRDAQPDTGGWRHSAAAPAYRVRPGGDWAWARAMHERAWATCLDNLEEFLVGRPLPRPWNE